jgi:autotransporter-associated beta strand protein
VTGTGNLLINNIGLSTNLITLTGATINPTGSITAQGSAVGSNIISAVIGANVTNITQNSASCRLILSGANTYSGDTTVTAGTLQLGAAGVIPDGSGKGNVSVTGTLDLNTYSETINGLSGAGTVDTVAGGTPTLTVGGNDQTSTFSGVIKNTAGTVALTKLGSGTLTLNGANLYSGTTTISAGTLALGASGFIPSSATINVLASATLDVSAVSFTLGGSQTLKGNGSIVGATTLNGALTPGASIGTLTFDTAPTLGGSIVAEINSAASPNADKVVVSSGTLTYGGTLTVTNIGGAPASGTTFDLFDGSLAGSFSTINLPGGTAHWFTANLAVDGTITFTNNAPTISNASVNRASGVTAKVKKSDLAANDLDGDTLTYTLGTSTNGATITQDATYLYVPTNNVNDQFTVTVSDGVGGSASANVTVNIVTTTGQMTGNVTLSGGNANLTFYGIPGTTYTVQRSTDLSMWTDITTVTADSNGLVSYVDVGAPTPNAYYQLKF